MSSAEDLRTIPAKSKRDMEKQSAAAGYVTCLTKPKVKTTFNGKQFTVLNTSGNAQKMMSAQRLVNVAVQNGFPLVPFLSCRDLLIVEEQHAANELQCMRGAMVFLWDFAETFASKTRICASPAISSIRTL